MKKSASAWYFKLLAWVLAFVCLALGAFGTVAFAAGYEQNTDYQTSWTCAERVRQMNSEIIIQFWRNPSEASWQRLLEGSDLRFIILDERTGDVVASYVEGMDLSVPKNLADNIYLKEENWVLQQGEADSFLRDVYVMDYYFGTDSNGDRWASGSSQAEISQHLHYRDDSGENVEEPEVDASSDQNRLDDDWSSYQILDLLPMELDTQNTDTIAEGARLYREQSRQGINAPLLLTLASVGLLAAVIFLCVTSGWTPTREKAAGTVLERVPLELHLIAGFFGALGVCLCISVAYDTAFNVNLTVSEWYLVQTLCALGAAACAVVVMELLLTVVLRCKLGTFWQSSLIWRILNGLWRGIRLAFCAIGLVPQAILCVLAIAAVEVIGLFWMLTSWSPELPLVLMIVFNVLLLLAIFWVLGQLRLLQKAAGALAEGNLDYRVDTSHMYWVFRKHGENLNAISDGMGKAVEKQLKSERLKGELITNVSHDIKTPLTSIINYVDLLQKAQTEAERIQYLEVLERQSKRLKRLTENLVEASKASTGNLAVTLAPTSVMELVNQSVEEYRDRLEAGRLEVVISQRGDLSILADGKLMWRIMDNLLSNVVKYALPGTRVYVTAQKDEEQVVIAVKNISRDPLNIDADELMERFVRGDSSRHTEGSGLGLNIAQSLTRLQNGQFTLTVDGDLFKAEVAMPVAK